MQTKQDAYDNETGWMITFDALVAHGIVPDAARTLIAQLRGARGATETRPSRDWLVDQLGFYLTPELIPDFDEALLDEIASHIYGNWATIEKGLLYEALRVLRTNRGIIDTWLSTSAHELRGAALDTLIGMAKDSRNDSDTTIAKLEGVL